jgi:hypothetical protein
MKLTADGISIVTLYGHGPEESRFDRTLLRAVARANHWRERLESGAARSAYDLARCEGCRVSYVQRHLALAFLAARHRRGSPRRLATALLDIGRPAD